jgi:hypothetical protein
LGYGGFTCLAPADAGQFTVPSYILSALPPGNGGVALQNAFQLPLSATGIDIGVAAVSIGFSGAAVAFQ